ncbi:CYTH domain-containing protein [Microlunatus aurantiacus]|uniref:CYTH domain-containing protein n=1 Tax=Microlunatus aurantiacus TaxID=446786 RepID=A0ABP7EAK0_9ACTN
MGTEFEHKLVVVGDEWRDAVIETSALSQAYLSTTPGMTIRVRVVDDAHAFLTIKGKQVGIGRPEYEYEIPVDDARALLAMITEGFPITKTRYALGDPWPGWIVDEFAGANAGLVVAELEVPTEETPWEVPVWAGENVTDDFRYTNAELFGRPFSQWGAG